MMITTREIRKQLKAIWPGLEFVLFTDPFFYLWSPSELSSFVDRSKSGSSVFVPHFNACEEAMDEMMMEAKAIMYPEGGRPGNRAMFRAFAQRVAVTADLPDPRHWLCIACTTDGLRMVDPRSKKIWSPDNEIDEVVFVFG